MEQDSGSVVCAATQKDDCLFSQEAVSVVLKVVPVKVWANDPVEHNLIYAFIDEGSNLNMCSSHLAKRLGVQHQRLILICLRVMQFQFSIAGSMTWSVIQGVNELEAFRVREAFVVDYVVDVSFSVPINDLVQRYSHLRILKFSVLEEGRADLLLDCDLHLAFLIKSWFPTRASFIKKHPF